MTSTAIAMDETELRQVLAHNYLTYEEFRPSCRGTLVDGKLLWKREEVFEVIGLLHGQTSPLIRLP